MVIDSMPSSYVIHLGNDEFKFTQFNYPYDVPLLHKWLNAKHTIEQWKLNKPLSELNNYFFRMTQDKHQRLYIISLNGIPFSYCEVYSAFWDRISNYYNSSDLDVGWHLLVGEREYISRSLIKKIVYIISEFIFNTTNSSRIIGEPDVRVKWNVIADDFNYISQGVIQLPEKTALLYFCNKNEYHNSLGYFLNKNLETPNDENTDC